MISLEKIKNTKKIKNINKKIMMIMFLIVSTLSRAVEPVNTENIENQIENLNNRMESSDSSGEVFYVGEQLFKLGKYEEAKKAFLKGKTENRNLLGAATSARLSGKNSEAIKYYDELISKDSNINEGYFGRALAYRELEEYNKSISDFKKYLEREKSEKREYAYAGLGDLYIITGKNSEAKYILEEGSRNFPNSTLIKKLLTRAYSK